MKIWMYVLITIITMLALLYLLVVNPVSATFDNNIQTAVETNELERHVDFLCAMDPPRSFEQTESLNKCADYIALQFVNAGLPTERQRYEDGAYSFQNVIAQYNPDAKERVVLGAHYDVCGPYQGADDNASGVAGLLELARVFAKNKPELEYGIDFVAYSTEEPPYFRTNLMGSAVHAESLKQDSTNVKLMVVLEMIGYFSEDKGSQEYPIGALKGVYPTTANFIAVVGRTKEFGVVRTFKKKMMEASQLPVASINTPVIFQGIDFSDHRNYWSRGMKAIMITNTSFFRTPHYHTPNDTPETLDFEKMTEVVKGTYWAITHL